jgi:hypothetical protein
MAQLWKDVGKVLAIYRYPVKGMRGESLQETQITTHGLPGDRRFAFSDAADKSDFPWLTGRLQAEMIRYAPDGDPLNGHLKVKTPQGKTLDLASPELLQDMAGLYNRSVSLVQNDNGVYDAMPLSLISQPTVDALCKAGGVPPDARRFRPNILLQPVDGQPFAEELWISAQLRFGDGGAVIKIDRQNKRCRMINLEPDTAVSSPEMLKYVTQQRDQKAGIYARVVTPGVAKVGDLVKMLMEF